MSYLLRVALPDVPGSLGRLASAIGSAGGNIDAIEIVERSEGRAVDDVFLAPEPGVMPDSIVSACTSLPDVEVLWISRYGAGSNLTRDLEVVEAMTSDPEVARDTLVDLLPATFVVDWAVRVRREGAGAKVQHGTPAAPTEVPEDISWPLDLQRGRRIEVPERLSEMLLAGCSLNDDEMVVIARRGGPEILDSEIARLCHLVALAASISS
ncbi:MAG: ACT domain-containing protein [Marmoricola sp.]